MLPIRLREQFGFQIGQSYDFYIHSEDGKKYLCIECPPAAQADLDEARRFLEEHGFSVKKE